MPYKLLLSNGAKMINTFVINTFELSIYIMHYNQTVTPNKKRYTLVIHITIVSYLPQNSWGEATQPEMPSVEQHQLDSHLNVWFQAAKLQPEIK